LQSRGPRHQRPPHRLRGGRDRAAWGHRRVRRDQSVSPDAQRGPPDGRRRALRGSLRGHAARRMRAARCQGHVRHGAPRRDHGLDGDRRSVRGAVAPRDHPGNASLLRRRQCAADHHAPGGCRFRAETFGRGGWLARDAHMSATPEITFFMIVTPRDVVIADYAVRSYGRIRDLDFKLAVYSNYLLPEQKAYYFPRWDALPFVALVRNPHHDADLLNIGGRINAERLEGPFEYCDPIWDRELRNYVTPFVATVDADFEILRPRFLTCMMQQLRAEPDLVSMSTDYSPTDVVHEPYTGNTIILNERNHTWFCIYKQI